MRKTAILVLLLCFAMTMAAQTEPDNNNKQNNHPDTCVHLSEIVVTGLTGNTQLRNSPIPVNVISTEALQTLSFSNIIDAIAKYPGIAQITTGGGISKPVIRGMGYNRVLVVNDGIRQEGQQWGDEHGVEIDGESVHAVEVIKGPASLMYGSDAMAGVIIMHDAPASPTPTSGTTLLTLPAIKRASSGMPAGARNTPANMPTRSTATSSTPSSASRPSRGWWVSKKDGAKVASNSPIIT